MQALSTPVLLQVWERGLGTPLSQRALTLLAAASPESSGDQLARLPIGQRDTRLLRLRELTFGPQLKAIVHCRGCGAQLDFTFDVADATTTSPSESSADETFIVALGSHVARFRLPNSLDLAAIGEERDIARARTLLLHRCVLSVTDDGRTQPVADAPHELLDSAIEEIARLDPQADIDVAFTCPSCGDQRAVAFDIASFFWSEVDAWAARTLVDVHTLATAYGWREADILLMNPRRRQRYLDLVG
jgi:hypothetical protein